MKKSLSLLVNLGVCIILILTAFSFATPVLAKAPSSNGAIAGKVLDIVTGKPIPSVGINITDKSGAVVIGSGQTKTDGTYSISVPAGTYRAQALPSPLSYSDQWYNGIDNFQYATDIIVKSGATTSNIYFRLAPFGTIAGYVYDDASRKPVKGATVNLQASNSPTILATFTTGSDGAYYFSGLSGSYKVMALAKGYAQQFYKGVLRFGLAQTIEVNTTSKGAANIDFYLIPGGTISGIVTDQFTGQVISGISILIQGSSSIDSAWIVITGSDGKYSINLRDDTYIIDAPSGRTDPSGNPIGVNDVYYVQEYWKEVATSQDATSVIIDAKHISNENINFTLSVGTISGTVYDADSGQPISNASVAVISAVDNLDGFVMRTSSQTVTDTNGNYILYLPHTGPYVVEAVAAGHERRWYPDSLYIERDLDIINIDNGSIITSIDFHLGSGGTISGRVTDVSTSKGLPDVSVWAFANIDTGNNNAPIACITHTDALGYYKLDGLAFGTNYVVISPFSISIGTNRLQSGDMDYISEFWQEDSALPHTPDNIILTSESPNRTGINFTLEQGGTISGRVTVNGTPVLYASVTAYKCGTTPGYWDQFCTGGYTDTDGYYKTSGLSAGDYILSVIFWYNGAQYTYNYQEVINVVVSQDSSGKDFVIII